MTRCVLQSYLEESQVNCLNSWFLCDQTAVNLNQDTAYHLLIVTQKWLLILLLVTLLVELNAAIKPVYFLYISGFIIFKETFCKQTWSFTLVRKKDRIKGLEIQNNPPNKYRYSTSQHKKRNKMKPNLLELNLLQFQFHTVDKVWISRDSSIIILCYEI